MKKVFKTMAFTLLGLVLSVNLMAETKTYDITFDSSDNGNNDVHWTGSSVTSLTHDNVTWSTSVTGTTSFTASKTYCQIGSQKNPATKVTISTIAFAGKKITKASLTGYCMSNTGPTLTVTAGTTTIINAKALVKSTSTVYKTADDFSGVTLGSSDALTFTINSSAKAAICISKIEVTYEEGTTPTDPVDPTVTFKGGTVKATKTLDLSTLYSSNSTGAVTYAITKGDAATINGSILTGVTAGGSVEVTASQAAATGYNAKETTATITVTAAPVETTFSLVTDASDLEEGQNIIIVSSDAKKALGPQSGNNCPAKDVICTDNKISVEEGSDVQVIALGKAQKDSKDYWTFSVGESTYLCAASSSSNYLKTQETLDNNGKWSISLNNNEAAIVAQGSYSRNSLRYNSSSSIFSCYSSGQAAVKIFAEASTDPSIKLNKAETSLSVDAYEILVATVKNSSATVAWSSSDEGVATVGQDGKVTAKAKGTATITAKINEGGKDYSATCEVTVTPKATVTSVTISPAEDPTLYIYGSTKQTSNLTATVTGENSPAQTVTWTSSNTDVAIVSNAGVVTAVGAGETTITATSTVDDTKSATRGVKVVKVENTQETAYTAEEAIALYDALTNKIKDIEVYVKGTVSSIPTPWDDGYKNITYNISKTGLTSEKQFQLYRCATNGAEVGDKVIAKGKITYYNPTYEFAAGNTIVSIRKAAKLAWSAGAYTAELGLGEYNYPTLTKTPTTLTGVTYSSSNTDVATIDATGVITLKAEGETTITASFAGDATYDAAEDATYILTVAAEVQRFTITYNSNGGSEIDPVENQTNLPATFPTPTKDWKVFGGWYLDNETFENPAVANAPLTDNTTLFAKWNAPLSITEMMALIPNANDQKNDIYGWGYITQVDEVNGYATYWITDGENDFEVFKGKNIDGANFSAASELPIGNKVMIFGNIKNFKGTPEFDANNQLIHNDVVTTPVEGVSLDKTEATIFVGQTTTLVATIAPAFATNQNVSWSSSDEDVATVENGVVTGVAKGSATITVTTEDGGKTATCVVTVVELPIWATTYTSNVTVGTDKVRFSEDGDQFDAKKTGSSSTAGTINIKVPIGACELHYHAAAWSSKSETLTIKNGNTTIAEHSILADAGLSNNSPFTLKNNPADEYYMIKFEPALTEETTLTFSASSNRFILFGVNAIQPATITIDPEEKNFGEVKANSSSEPFEFTIEPNDFVEGTPQIEIIGEDAAWFSYTAITDNAFTVTFSPEDEKEVCSATLNIKLGNEVMCSASLTGKAISATTPEIVVSDDEIDFGKVKQDATVADQTVTVTLNYLDAATASISENDAFTISPTSLVLGENTITISATASSMGAKNATITITGEDATTKTIAVKMDVTSKWAGEYTSNVKVESDKVIIAEEEYEAVKAGTGKVAGSTTITVPEGAYALHFHAAGWNNEDVTLSVKNGDTELGPFDLYKDAGVTGNSPFTLQGENYDTDQYFYVEFDALEEETTFTFAATSGNRFVLYGVNQEGGLTKELSAIEVSSTPDNLQYTEGDAFDPTGLTVIGTFKFGEETLPDKEDVTDQVTEWIVSPETLASTTTFVSVVAKVGEIASEEYIVENVRVLPENTDIINASTGTATTSTYKEFTATGLTNTKYAGKTALNDGNLTLSNAASHPGIVSTYTIGYIKSVKVTIADDNTHNLDVYGSHRAYQSAEDLYSKKNAIRGTKIGTLTASGVLDLSEAETKYEFIGIRSEEGAIQIPEIQITWTPVEFLRISVAENIEGGTIDIDRTVATAEEAGNVQVTIEPTPNEGLQFDKLVIYNESDEDVTSSITIAESGLSFTMPDYSVKVGATFKSQPVTAISLDKSAITIDKNSTETLTASFLPQGAFTEVTWTSDNEAIATVENGVVTGKGQGTTTITASCNDGVLTATCSVTVNAQPEYELVTNANTLQDGDVIVLGSAAKQVANGGYNSDKYLDKVDVDITEGVLTTANELMEITLCKTDAGWNLVTEQGHLGAVATKKLLIHDVYTDWTISISGNEGNPATISAGETPGRFLYNVNSPRFVNYSSATSQTMLLPEIYRLSNNTKKVVKLMDNNNVYAIYRVQEGENVTLSVELPTGCTEGWVYNDKTYTKGATIENVTTDMVLYAIQSEEIINENKEISSKDVNQGSTITIGDGTNETNVTITSDTQEKAQAYQIVVKKNATVTISTPSDISNLEVEIGGKVTVETTKKLTVNNFVIKSTMAGGQSGQVMGVTETNFEITGEAYYDVVMDKCAEGSTIADQWHAFAVPFNVDAINGVYDTENNKLTNEVHYAIMDYHGDVRAQGQYGWKKFRGIMTPGTFYLMTVDGERTTYRMKMNGGFTASSTTITVNQYASGTDTDAGWNGIANNQLGYSSLGVDVQVLNPTSYTYELMTASSTNFTVGTPFFYQASATGTIDLTAPNASENYAPRRVGAAEAKNIAVTLGNDNYTDRLYISATDEATDEYQIGRDLVKMTMTNAPAVPQIFAEAYGTKLCMVDAPMMYDEAVYALNLYAPTNGEYTIGAAQVEGYEVFLTQYGSVIWNLSMSEATIELTKGNNTEYGLILKATSGHAPTDINTLNGQESVQKFLYNSNIYIRHNNKTFDVQGQLVK